MIHFAPHGLLQDFCGSPFFVVVLNFVKNLTCGGGLRVISRLAPAPEPSGTYGISRFRAQKKKAGVLLAATRRTVSSKESPMQILFREEPAF